MSECHIWVWGENCAIWVVSRKGQGNFYRDHCTEGPRTWTPESACPESSVLALSCASCGTLRKSADFSSYHIFL